MYITETSLRVRYAETDRMGYAYYGNYATYFEIGRVEALRSLGVSYKELEDNGIILPVRDFSIRYFKPAFYDDLLTIKTSITALPSVRIHFKYETFNEKGELLNEGETTLVFVNTQTGKPCEAPAWMLNSLKKYF